MIKNLVSIIIPYYKKREFIKKTLDSVFNQSYKFKEIILIYDDPKALERLPSSQSKSFLQIEE